jgi:hypothetical protein
MSVRKSNGAAENKGGRPTKLTPELVDAVVASIGKGSYPDVAAQAEGIAVSTYYDWMRKGRAGIEPYAGFCSAIARACAASEIDLLDRVREGDEKGESFGVAKASLEMLGRRFPRRWSPSVKHELTESNRMFFETVASVCSRNDVFDRVREAGDCSPVFEAICEELARLDGEGDPVEDPVVAGQPIH